MVDATENHSTEDDQPLAVQVRLSDLVALKSPACGAMFSVSESTWKRWSAADKVPAPIRIGGNVFWRRTDLLRWAELGCPNRKEFERLVAAERLERRTR